MEPQFWHDRWTANQIGFHEGRPNGYLLKYFDRLEVPRGARIFVPLCGKGVDMYWLMQQGYEVLGVELSPIAVEAFFAENGLAAQSSPDGPFTRWRGGSVEILCGDYFDLTEQHLAGVAAVYDRAALIALPPALRDAYVEHLRAILPPGIRHLLITLDYPEGEMQGPPFSVDVTQVRRLFGAHCTIELLESRDALRDSPHLREKGLTRLHEHAFRLLRC